MQENNTPTQNRNINSETLVSASVRVFDPLKKITMDLLITENMSELKKLPEKIFSHIMQLHNYYTEAYHYGNIFSMKYYDVLTDYQSEENMNKILKHELNAIKKMLMSDDFKGQGL